MIGITVTFMFHNFSLLWQGPYICPTLFFPSLSLCSSPEWQNPLGDNFFSSCLLKIGLVFWSRLDDPFISQSLKELYAFHFQGQILVCADL